MKPLPKLKGFRSRAINAMADAIERNRPIAGPGLLSTQGPAGIVLSLARRPADVSAATAHAWAVKYIEAEESYAVYIPKGSARIFLTDTPDFNLASGKVTIGLSSADVGGDWYVFDGSIGEVWASVSNGEIIVSMTANSQNGGRIAEITSSSIIQIARSPLEFFIAASDPDAPAPLPPGGGGDDADECDQNTHPGAEDADEDVHPGDSDGDDSAAPGGGESDEDDTDHPGAADCYTTT
jgi:hypothetical protein